MRTIGISYVAHKSVQARQHLILLLCVIQYITMKQRKKVLYVITKSNMGGAQQYVYDIAYSMRDRADISVATGNKGPLTDKLQRAGIRTHTVAGMVRDIGAFREAKAFVSLFKLFREERPDVVHLNSSKAGVLGSLAARLNRISCITFTAHGWPFHEQRSWWWRKIAWSGSWLTALLSHQVICVSQYDADHTHMPFVQSKLRVIPIGVGSFTCIDKQKARAALFTPEEQKKHVEDIWVVTIAELTPNKNHYALLDAVCAYNRTHEKQVYYSILGDGEQRTALESYIAQHNMSQFVKLHGFVADGRTYLHAFDIFALVSKKEGLPYAILEAGVASMPAVASAVGGIPEIIEHEKNGFLIDPFDSTSIVGALDTLGADERFRQKLGETLHERVSNSFSRERMLRETAALYTETHSISS